MVPTAASGSVASGSVGSASGGRSTAGAGVPVRTGGGGVARRPRVVTTRRRRTSTVRMSATRRSIPSSMGPTTGRRISMMATSRRWRRTSTIGMRRAGTGGVRTPAVRRSAPNAIGMRRTSIVRMRATRRRIPSSMSPTTSRRSACGFAVTVRTASGDIASSSMSLTAGGRGAGMAASRRCAGIACSMRPSAVGVRPTAHRRRVDTVTATSRRDAGVRISGVSAVGSRHGMSRLRSLRHRRTSMSRLRGLRHRRTSMNRLVGLAGDGIQAVVGVEVSGPARSSGGVP